MRIKLLGPLVTLTTIASNTGLVASDIYINHDSGGNAARIVTITENDGTTVVGSFSCNPGANIVIHIVPGQKLKINSGTDITATPISYIS